jgi:hypothetical protein
VPAAFNLCETLPKPFRRLVQRGFHRGQLVAATVLKARRQVAFRSRTKSAISFVNTLRVNSDPIQKCSRTSGLICWD